MSIFVSHNILYSFGDSSYLDDHHNYAPPPPPQLTFTFDAVFGDNMVLQQQPSQAAIYGYLPSTGTSVTVTVIDASNGNVVTTVPANFNMTQQPFGEDWGVRPCSAADCPPYLMNSFTPFGVPLPTFKALLPPMQPGGNFTIIATCEGCNSSVPSLNITLNSVTFGDVWYCSGQSNAWLPVIHTFSRNDTANNITVGKYSNIRLMAGASASVPYAKWPPSYGGSTGSNPWMTAEQAVPADCVTKQNCPLFQLGGTCWYFVQGLADAGVTTPIGILDTAIGGQRIEEYMNNHTINQCTQRLGENIPWWDSQLFGQQILPFVDMTIKGWVWYQGENNMGGTKGNSIANVGYGCMQQVLVQGWRDIWSVVPNTTDKLAPFGLVTLASSGSEGGPNMGAMRWAQTANYGVLPNPAMPNTFLAQAGDLDDPWGPASGPCFGPWFCCGSKYNKTACAGRETLCAPACAADADTASVMGGIHPRNKKPVGDRLAQAAYNTVYGGNAIYTGPTLSSCGVSGSTMIIQFNSTLLRGDTVQVKPFPAFIPPSRFTPLGSGGSQLWVQTNASLFCMEAVCVTNATTGECVKNQEYCPSWAGGDNTTIYPSGVLDSNWILLNYTAASSGIGINVDLTPLQGQVPTAVRYTWGILDCCDHTDPNLYVTHGCEAACPIMALNSQLPANPFQAKITNNRCECIAPQTCNEAINFDEYM